MAHKFPLQPGDRTQGQSGMTESSTVADRRATEQSGLANPPGENAAPSFGEADSSPLWKVGQVHPNSFLTAPYPVIHTEGDTSGTGTEEYEINIYEYGDAYDPTSTVRSRTAPWDVDTDFDGSKN
jgi:hypothetical protein